MARQSEGGRGRTNAKAYAGLSANFDTSERRSVTFLGRGLDPFCLDKMVRASL